MEKDKSGANFTKSEIDQLIDIVCNYRHIVENKRTDGATRKDKDKDKDKICKEFNAVPGNFPRSTKTIRLKYDNIKKNICKKCFLMKNEQIKTGGDQCLITLIPNEGKILSLTPNTTVDLASRFDSDYAGNYYSIIAYK